MIHYTTPLTVSNIKIVVIIPTRGDREVFLQNCCRMLGEQTLKANYVKIIDYPSESNDKDITQRYRLGYDIISKMNCFDLIAFIEDDDYYAPDYLETMATEWLRAGNPDMMGTNSTIYYHVKLNKYFTFNHQRRSSAMNMLIKPGLNLKWPEDNYAFTDLHLWNMSDVYQNFIPDASRILKDLWIKSHLFQPDKIISIGIKHGVGLCGGRNHIDRLERYDKPDTDMAFLRANMDSESFKFYSTLFK